MTDHAARPIPADRAAWLALRQGYIGASEVAALFGAQPDYALGLLALWNVKAGRMEPPVVDNARTRAGLALEDAIALLASEAEGWDVRPGFYATHASGLGVTLDRVIAAPGANDAAMAGPGVLELKNVDWLQHKRVWVDGEPPLHILLQLQAQLLATGYSWGAVAALVGGNEVRVYRYTARPRIHADMAAKVAAFWRSVQAGEVPNADPSDSAWRAMAATTPLEDRPEPLDLTDDEEADRLAQDWMREAARRKEAEKAEAAAKNRLTQRIGGHARAIGSGWAVTLSDVPGTPDRPAEPGEIIKGRAGHRRAIIKEAA